MSRGDFSPRLIESLANLYKEMADVHERLNTYSMFPPRSSKDRHRQEDLRDDLDAVRNAILQSIAQSLPRVANHTSRDCEIWNLGVAVGLALSRSEQRGRRQRSRSRSRVRFEDDRGSRRRY